MKIEFSELSIIELKEFKFLLLETVKNHDDDTFTLDFVNVEKIDLVNIQVLLSCKKYCDELNIKFKCANLQTNQLKQSIEIYNLNNTLGISC